MIPRPDTRGIPATYRGQPVEIIGRHGNGKTIIREVGKLWPGVGLVEPGEARLDDPVQDRLLAKLRQAGVA